MSNRTLTSGAVTAVLVLTALVARPVSAADLGGYSNAVQQDPAEFGSGWYIRGDLAATRIPSITTSTPATPTAANLNVNPSAPVAIVTRGSDLGYDAGLGFGYKFNQWFRADVTGDFHQPVASKFSAGNATIFCPTGVSYPKDAGGNYTLPATYASGGCTGTYTGRINSYDVMLNGYIDFGTWYNVTPYAGAGAGLGFGRWVTSSSYVQSNNVPYQNVTITDPYYNTTFTYNYNRTASGYFYNFAWALMGGVAIDVFPQTKLDIGYRYLNLGSISGVSGKLTSQEVHAGLRYLIDR